MRQDPRHPARFLRPALAAALRGLAFGLALAGTAAAGPRLEEGEIATRLVPGPVKYRVLLPEAPAAAPLGLLLFLHGGGGSSAYLETMQGLFEEAFAKGILPPIAVATPDAGRSLYMDYKDGSQKWETFLMTEFLPAIRSRYRLSAAREKTVVSGISMGGLGSLRLAFNHPETFGGLAALEAGIEPALSFDDLKLRNHFQRTPDFFEERFGKPVDRAFWKAYNPANIALANRGRILSSCLAIYLEVGDRDEFYLDEGNEFLHRLLYDQDIPHEYRLVRGAGHVDSTARARYLDGFRFLKDHVLEPAPPPSANPATLAAIAAMKKTAGLPEDPAPACP